MTTYHPNGTVESETGDIGGHAGSSESTRERIGNQVNEMRDDLSRRAQETHQSVDRAVRTASDEGARFVRENPGVALAGALGLGVIIGLAMRGRG